MKQLKPKLMKTSISTSAYSSNYSESSFWSKLKGFAAKMGQTVVYYALLLYYVMVDPTVSLKDKAVIAGALGYLILPVDLIPDTIPVLGFTDDIAALKVAYNTVRNSVTPEIRTMAEAKLVHLFGAQCSHELW